MSDIAEVAAGGDAIVLSERVTPKAFLGLSVRNGLLNLVTLTLYRFWGKTEVRRRLWAATYLNGEPFEYSGRGVELFLGFLIALALIVLPFLLVVFGAQFLGPAVAAAILVPVYIFLGFLGGFGRFTAFRYLASRTAWRGVRFRLLGSPAKYAWSFLGYGVLSVITLGWFWPAAERRLAGRLWGGLSFGDRPLKFRLDDARKMKVYGAYALGWLGFLVCYIALMTALMGMAFMKAKAGGTPPAPRLEDIVQVYVLMGLFAAGYAIVFAPFHAAMLRSIVAGIGFDEVRFKLKLKWWDLAAMWLSNMLLAVVSLGLLMPFIEARAWKFLMARLEPAGTTDMSTIGQAPGLRPRTGEGLADAFGIATV